MPLLIFIVGWLLSQMPCAVLALVPAGCSAARRCDLRPRVSNDVVAMVPLVGWIVARHVPHLRRGPPGEFLAELSAACVDRMRKPVVHFQVQ